LRMLVTVEPLWLESRGPPQLCNSPCPWRVLIPRFRRFTGLAAVRSGQQLREDEKQEVGWKASKREFQEAPDPIWLVVNAGFFLPGRSDEQRPKSMALGRADGRAARLLPCQLQLPQIQFVHHLP